MNGKLRTARNSGEGGLCIAASMIAGEGKRRCLGQGLATRKGILDYLSAPPTASGNTPHTRQVSCRKCRDTPTPAECPVSD